jgi:chemotaxis protein histidine kinase CheA
VNSQPGEGSTFRVDLPRTIRTIAAIATAPVEPPPRTLL